MALRADDAHSHVDLAIGAGTVTRTITISQEEQFGSEWGDARGAAATSLAALDAWYAAGPSARNTWFAAHDSTWRENFRQAMLKLS